ncbi:MAG: hypothetical protein LBF68_05730 [Christensenellaceae bacterium]|nr:hypothetical protein [Christensenellaceae bacterium]
MEFLKNLTKLLKTDLDFLDLGQTFGPAIYLCLAGIVAILIALVISVFVSKGSNGAKLTKRIAKVTNNIRNEVPIDENNINEFNKNFTTLPESIKRGWSGFLSIQTKYPSDYIKEKDIVEDPVEKATATSFKSFFIGASALIAVILAVLSVGIQAEIYEWKFNLNNIVFIALETLFVVVPLLIIALFFIFRIDKIANKQQKKLSDTIEAFLLALDNCLILYREERDEFSTENIEEIDAAIEKLLGGKVEVSDDDVSTGVVDETSSSILEFVPLKPENDDEIVDSVDAVLLYDESAMTTKVVEQTDELDDIEEAEQVDAELNEYIEELVTEPIDSVVDDIQNEEESQDTIEEDDSKEEEPLADEISDDSETEVIEDAVKEEPILSTVESVETDSDEEESVLDAIKLEEGEEDISTDLVVLVQAVDAAVSDPITTKDDLEELTLILDDARRSGIFERKVEQLIFDTCFEIVAEIYFKYDA